MQYTLSQQERSKNKLKVALIVDSEISSKYVYELAEWGQHQNNLEISHLIIQNAPFTQQNKFKKAIYLLKKKGLFYLLQHIGFYLINKIELIELKRRKTYKNHSNKYNLSESVKNNISITPIISKSGFIYRYDDSDIQKIKKLDLDVLIRCGSGILRGEILNCVRFGIISLHYADNRINRGHPPGFWEVFLKQDSTGFTIQQLTEELDGGNVLYRGSFATKFFYMFNQAILFEKSYYYLKKILTDIAIKKELPNVLDSFPYFNPLYKLPNLRIQFKYSLSLSLTILNKVLNKILIKKKYRRGVAFNSENWKNLVMWRGKKIKNPPNRFLADPFVVSLNNENYCFVEDYDYLASKGCISVYKLSEKDAERIGEAIVEPFHMSFPYIFEYQSKFYMCPETCENKDLRLYECERFPVEWKINKIIMSNVCATNTMIFEKDGIWWLFTNIDPLNIGDQCSELSIFYSDNPLTDNWAPHPRNPIFVDAMKARNGGILFDNNFVYRVSQQSEFDMYGKTSSLNRIIHLTKTDYVENLFFKIESNFFKKLKGTQHIHSNGKFTVFDFIE